MSFENTSLMPRASAAVKAFMQKANERTAIYFGASIGALAAFLILAHFASVAMMSFKPKSQEGRSKSFIVVARFVRSVLLHKVPLFNSAGHAIVFVAYIAINIVLTLQNLDLTVERGWAKRLGWIATCNIALITFLALKNTPLAFLTAYSYERLNILHQAAGYCTVFFSLLHAVVYISTDANIGSLSDLLELEQIMGEVAGIAMLIILISALTLRYLRYEAFYLIHITMFILILIAVAVHRPTTVTKSVYIIFFTSCLWFSDRLIRGLRIIWYFFGNRATIHPLPQGGVRIVMQRTPWRAVSGTHIFLWIPRIRPVETHPFTIVSTHPLELVISPQDGFTKDLFDLATKTPGFALRASCDGPYGTLPNFARYEHVVLVAGGTGATFTFGVALNLLRNVSSTSTKPMIHFIWVIRDHEIKTWFSKELTNLAASPLVNISIYVSRSTLTLPTLTPNLTTEKSQSQSQSFSKSDSDIEKSGSGSVSPSESSLPTMLGRPDISGLLREIVTATRVEERTIVAACGPGGLMKDVRGVVGEIMGSGQRGVELHCEVFGW